MTVKRIAELCGVSVATVSKAFSGSHEIPETTRARVFEVARREGCFDKYYKGPRDRRTVAILCPETGSEYYGRIVDLLNDAFRALGCDTVVGITDFDRETEARLFSAMVYRSRVDGVVVLGGGADIRNPDRVPAVVVGAARHPAADTVQIDYEDAMRDAVRLLKENGHRRVGYIGEEHTGSTLELFRRVMRQAGLGVYDDLIVCERYRFGEGGYRAMQTLLSREKLPTAVVAAYDYMAFGAMRCARDHGLAVPGDVSFIGMNDLAVDSYLDVPLTSVRSHTEQMCRDVAELLLSAMMDRCHALRRLSFRAELCVRASVAPCRIGSAKNGKTPPGGCKS